MVRSGQQGIPHGSRHEVFGGRRAPERPAAGVRSPRAGSAGRRGAGSLPGRRIPGAAGGWPGARLGVRRVDRCDQRGHHCRQTAGKAAADLLGAHHPAPGVALHAGRRHLPQGAQRGQLVADRDVRAARLLRPPPDQPLAEPRRLDHRDQLLRQFAAARDAARTGRFFAHQRQADPAGGRCGQRPGRQLRLLRQHHRHDHARACDGERRPAAGAADGQDRHRPFLGRRHRLQHAAAAPARAGRPHQHPGLPGRPVQCPRDAAARHPRGDGPPEGHHVFLAHPLHDRSLSQHPLVEDEARPGAGQGSGRAAERRGAPAEGRTGRPARDRHPAAHLPAEILRRTRQGLRVLRHVDARALAQRLRGHVAHGEAPQLDRHAARGRRHRGPRRASRAGYVARLPDRARLARSGRISNGAAAASWPASRRRPCGTSPRCR